jgi:hypothetical protein
MPLKASRPVLVRRLTPFDAASCNKNRVVLDRYEVVMFSGSDGLLCTAVKEKTKNRLRLSPCCCFKFYTEVTKSCGSTYCAAHSLRTCHVVSSS